MKKRSVLAAVTLATGAVIAAIAPHPGGDTAHAAEPPLSLGALDNVSELGQVVDGAAETASSTAGTVTTTLSDARFS